MITNQRQYGISCALREKFERAVAEIKTSPQGSRVHPRLITAEQEALASQLAELLAEIKDYENR